MIFTLLFSIANAYQLCKPSDRPDLHNKTFPIKPGPTFQLTINQVNVPVDVQGNLRIIDGCTFETINFRLLGTFSATWYGGKKGDSNGIKLIKETIPASPGIFNTTYEFVKDVFSPVSFNDFEQFRLFEVGTNAWVATVDLKEDEAPVENPVSSSSGKALSLTFLAFLLL